jgi:hypothetical protein
MTPSELPATVAEHQPNAKASLDIRLEETHAMLPQFPPFTHSPSRTHQAPGLNVLIPNKLAYEFPALDHHPVRHMDTDQFGLGSWFKVQANFSATSICLSTPLVRIRVVHWFGSYILFSAYSIGTAVNH